MEERWKHRLKIAIVLLMTLLMNGVILTKRLHTVKTSSTTKLLSAQTPLHPLTPQMKEDEQVERSFLERVSRARPARVADVSVSTTTTSTQSTVTTIQKKTTTTLHSHTQAAQSTTGISGDIWSKLAQCESGGNPTDVDRTGIYWGAFQFTLNTWHSMGMSGNPIDYSYEEQLSTAQRLQARSGWGQWPACSKTLGLR